MTRLDFDPDLERLGDALRASTAIDLVREEQAARSASAGRGRHAAGARVRRTHRRPRGLAASAASALGLAGVGAALVLALGGSPASPAFASIRLAVTRQPNGSVLVKVNLNESMTPWVSRADRKLAAMGIDEQIAVSYEYGAAPVSGAVNCTPLGGANTPPGPPVKVLFSGHVTQVSGSGNIGADSTMVSGCVYYQTSTPRAGGTGNTGAS
jgi:hypothetical protein